MRTRTALVIALLVVAALVSILVYARWLNFRYTSYGDEVLVVTRRLSADQTAGRPVTHLTNRTWGEQRAVEAIGLFESHNGTSWLVYVGDPPFLTDNLEGYFEDRGLIHTPVEYNGNYYELAIEEIPWSQTPSFFFSSGEPTRTWTASECIPHLFKKSLGINSRMYVVKQLIASKLP